MKNILVVHRERDGFHHKQTKWKNYDLFFIDFCLHDVFHCDKEGRPIRVVNKQKLHQAVSAIYESGCNAVHCGVAEGFLLQYVLRRQGTKLLPFVMMDLNRLSRAQRVCEWIESVYGENPFEEILANPLNFWYCYSRSEIDEHASLGIERGRLFYVPCSFYFQDEVFILEKGEARKTEECPPGSAKDDIIREITGKVVACGNNCRDYETLVRAASELPFEIHIISSELFVKMPGSVPDNVHVHDYVPLKTLYGVLSSARFVVVPILGDYSTPGAATAALSIGFGKPVVATQCPWLYDYLEDGVSGLFVEPGDAASLRDAMKRLYVNHAEREHMGAEARKLSNTLNNITERTLERIFRNATRSGGPSRNGLRPGHEKDKYRDGLLIKSLPDAEQHRSAPMMQLDKGCIMALRAALLKNHYDDANRLLAGNAYRLRPYAYEERERQVEEKRLTGFAEKTASLLRLFRLGTSMFRKMAQSLLGHALFEYLNREDILSVQGDIVLSKFVIASLDGHFFLADDRRNNKSGWSVHLDGDSYAFGNRLARERGFCGVDLCTGSGFQAILFSERANKLYATDILKKNTFIAEFNVLLNGKEKKIEIVHGDLFSSIKSEKIFDIVFSNPPFVPGPFDAESLAVGGGRYGLDVIFRILDILNRYLAPGGKCLLIGGTFGSAVQPFYVADKLKTLSETFPWSTRLEILTRVPLEIALSDFKRLCAGNVDVPPAATHYLGFVIEIQNTEPRESLTAGNRT